jgi:hypothetical protein
MSQDTAPKAPASALQRVCRLFIERWQPADPRDQDRFERDFMALARGIHRDASEPFLAALGLGEPLDAWRHDRGAMSERECFVARWAPENAQAAAFGADLIALTLAISRDAARPFLAALDLQARIDQMTTALRPIVISGGQGTKSKG